jgi:hypothetical protein
MVRTTSNGVLPGAFAVDSNSAVSYNAGPPFQATYSFRFAVRGCLDRYTPVLRWSDGSSIRHVRIFNQASKFVRRKLLSMYET